MSKIIYKLGLVCFFSLLFLSCNGARTTFTPNENEIDSASDIAFNNKVDILLVIDSSASMLQYRKKISDRINSFTLRLDQLKIDYRVGLASMSMDLPNQPCSAYARKLIGEPKYLTSENIKMLSQQLTYASTGCTVTRGLDSMAYVTSAKYLSSAATDFIRSDAFLSILFISDDDDHSFEFGSPKTEDFINRLDALKKNVPGYERGWMAHFIGHLNSLSTCDQLGVKPIPGSAYINLVHKSNGSSISICNNNVTDLLKTLSEKIIQTTRTIKFLNPPNEESIKVFVDTNPIPRSADNGWDLKYTHDPDNKTNVFLVFNGNQTPSPYQKVKIKYVPKFGI